MADLLFEADTLHSRYTTTVPLTEEQAKAPNLQGIGRVRDLREAAALSPALAVALSAYASADTKQGQMLALDMLIAQWAHTDPEFDRKPKIGLVSTDSDGSGGVPLTPEQIKALREGTVSISPKLNAELQALADKIRILDAFSGTNSATLSYGTKEQAEEIKKVTEETYGSLAKQIYRGLLFQTRLRPYLEEIGFEFKDGSLSLDFSAVEAAFEKTFAQNPEKAFIDLAELKTYGSEYIRQWSGAGALLLRYIRNGAQTGHLSGWLQTLGSDAAGLLGIQSGTEGNDRLYGKNGNNILAGGAGNDYLYGREGDDTLEGGTGDDYLSGEDGSDVYLFGRNFGKDTISDYNRTKGSSDTIRFTDGQVQEDFTFTRSLHDLFITAKDGSGSIQVHYYFDNDAKGGHQIDRIEFADGSSLNVEDVKKLVMQSTDGDDRLFAYSSGSTLDGGKGNDTVWGGKGADILKGGEGNDSLSGFDGDDILEGGTGDDYLSGEDGSDTYIFNKGDGRDTISDYGSKADTDTLRLGSLKLADMAFYRSGGDLVLRTLDQADSVNISGFFNGHGIERFEFADQTVQSSDFARYAQMANNLVQSMAVFGVQEGAAAASADSSAQPQPPLLAASPL